MNWMAQIDAYCERTDYTFWSEPINAVTNLAFVIAAVVMWRRVGRLTGARVLCAILFAIGTGSFLFHTFATTWASTADVIPIGLYILTYLFLVNLHVLNWPWWAALAGTLGFIPYAAGLVPLLDTIPFVRISNFYWTVPILLVIYAAFLQRSLPRVALGFVSGAALLCLSITLRSLDDPLCAALPMGTHFLWHVLNGIMLGWMTEVYRRHMLERPSPQG